MQILSYKNYPSEVKSWEYVVVKPCKPSTYMEVSHTHHKTTSLAKTEAIHTTCLSKITTHSANKLSLLLHCFLTAGYKVNSTCTYMISSRQLCIGLITDILLVVGFNYN